MSPDQKHPLRPIPLEHGVHSFFMTDDYKVPQLSVVQGNVVLASFRALLQLVMVVWPPIASGTCAMAESPESTAPMMFLLSLPPPLSVMRPVTIMGPYHWKLPRISRVPLI